MTDIEIEKEIQAKGKSAPRLTPDHIESVIVSEHYFTAGDGYAGAAALNAQEGEVTAPRRKRRGFPLLRPQPSV
ncbi:hypothetical protein G0T21_003124 [Salmonella enterica subsp. enterica]|nr:hypothetical protein [Salmonella enterica]ECS6813321.1 hypothetical protein [Salmonella enterica subsp. enterica serovar Newport]EEG4255002.1 hypothetical protein [Salmonella enterica subsp. enterica]